MIKMKKCLVHIATALALCLIFSLRGIPDREVVPAVEIQVFDAKIRLSEQELELKVGDQEKIKVKGAKGKVKWSSKDKKVATVSKKGKIKAVGGGETDIVAKVGKKKAKCHVTVSSPSETITLDKTEVTMNVGETLTLTATVFPTDHTDEIVWTSTSIGVATVEKGVVTAVAGGEATIQVTSGTKTASCLVHVLAPVISVSMDQTRFIMQGKTVALNVSTEPEYTTDPMNWTTADSLIASVDERGNVTGVSPGTTQITLSVGNQTAVCQITVITGKEDGFTKLYSYICNNGEVEDGIYWLAYEFEDEDGDGSYYTEIEANEDGTISFIGCLTTAYGECWGFVDLARGASKADAYVILDTIYKDTVISSRERDAEIDLSTFNENSNLSFYPKGENPSTTLCNGMIQLTLMYCSFFLQEAGVEYKDLGFAKYEVRSEEEGTQVETGSSLKMNEITLQLKSFLD